MTYNVFGGTLNPTLLLLLLLSATLMYCIEMAKHIIRICTLSGSQVVLVI